MFKILKLFLLVGLSGSIYGATDTTLLYEVTGATPTDTTPLLSDENIANQKVSGVYKFDICKLPDGLSWPWRILRWPLKSCMYLFKDWILYSTKYLASGFKFNPDALVFGLENMKGTCYAAALFQALKASQKFVSLMGDMASKEEDSRIEFPLAKSLKSLFDDMDNPNASINDIKSSHVIVSFLRAGFKTDQNVPIHFLEGIESVHYSKIAASMVSVAEGIEDDFVKNSIIRMGNNLVSKRGGHSDILFTSLWCALNAESQKVNQNGILSYVAGVCPDCEELWLSEFEPVEANGKYAFSTTTSSYVPPEPPSVLISLSDISRFNHINTDDPKMKYPVKLYKLVAIVVHHARSLFSGKHLTATVLGSDGNWHNTNNEFVFFVGPDLDIPPTTKMFVYELQN